MTRPITSLLAVIALTSWMAVANAESVISGDFDLIDHNGRPVNEHSFDGKLRLVFFGFTQCPDVCPTTLFEVSRALGQLGELAEEVRPLFISVDPKNDTQERLAAYVSAFHPSIVGLTGSAGQIDAAAAAFNVTYGVKPASEGARGREEVFHSAYIFLMNREGEFVDVFGYGTKAEIIAEAIRSHLAPSE